MSEKAKTILRIGIGLMGFGLLYSGDEWWLAVLLCGIFMGEIAFQVDK